MSYDVSLLDADGEILPFRERFEEGGTYRVGGVTECSLNITYNYAEVFGSLVKDLEGRRAWETLDELIAFCARFPYAKPYKADYWAPTPGNARKAIERLRRFAVEHPTGTWRIT